MKTKRSDIIIRKAVLEDINFLKECLVDSWMEHVKNAPELLSKEKLENFESKDFYIESIKNDKGYILIAETAGKSIGLVVAYQVKLGYFFNHPNSIYIDDVYVLQDYRRSGIARTLIVEIERIARENKISRIDNRVYAYNQPMQKLLSSMGYHTPYSTWTKILEH